MEAGPGYGAGPKPGSVWSELFFAGFALVILNRGWREGFDWVEWGWLFVLLLYAGSLLMRGIAWWRRRASPA